MIKAILFDFGGVMHDMEWVDIRDTKPHEEMFALVEFLKNKGYTTCVASNTIPEHAVVLREKGLYDKFDKVFLSFEINIRKPDPKFFEYILNDLKLSSDEVIFIDDLKENI